MRKLIFSFTLVLLFLCFNSFAQNTVSKENANEYKYTKTEVIKVDLVDAKNQVEFFTTKAAKFTKEATSLTAKATALQVEIDAAQALGVVEKTKE